MSRNGGGRVATDHRTPKKVRRSAQRPPPARCVPADAGVAFHFAHCGQLARGLSPPRMRPCRAHKKKPPECSGGFRVLVSINRLVERLTLIEPALLTHLSLLWHHAWSWKIGLFSGILLRHFRTKLSYFRIPHLRAALGRSDAQPHFE